MHSVFTRSVRRNAAISLSLVLSLAPANAAWAASAVAEPETEAQPEAQDETAPIGDAEAVPEPEAAAEPAPSEAEAWVAEGAAAFESGDYERAIQLFERAHAATGKPNLIFNIGRTHEELGNLQDAVDHYSEFVVQPGIDLETRQLASERIRVLREILRDTAEESAPPPEPKSSAPAVVPTQPPAASPRRTTPPARIAGYVLVGIGAAALAGGGALGGIASQRVSQADDALLVADGNALRRGARPLAFAADGLFIAGGAVALAGIIAIGVSFKSTRSQRTAVLPSFGREHAGLTWIARF